MCSTNRLTKGKTISCLVRKWYRQKFVFDKQVKKGEDNFLFSLEMVDRSFVFDKQVKQGEDNFLFSLEIIKKNIPLCSNGPLVSSVVRSDVAA